MRLDLFTRWFCDHPRTSKPRRLAQRRQLLLECLEERTVPTYTVHEFTLPNPDSNPHFITAGPDGNVWFAETNRNVLAKITPTGQITEIPLPNPESVGHPPGSLGAGRFLFGPDGNIWIHGRDLYEVDPTGAFLQWATDLASNSNPLGLALRSDNSLLWSFTDDSRIITAPYNNPQSISWYRFPSSTGWGSIVTAANGTIWATGSKVGRILPDGTMNEFELPPYPDAIELHRPGGLTFGPDGNLWMTEEVSVNYSQLNASRILRMNTDGQFTGEFVLPDLGTRLLDITAGPDGALWFTQYGTNQIGRITTDGVIEDVPLPPGISGLSQITTGPDGNIWFTENSNKIGQIVLNQPPTADAGGPYTVVRGGSVTLNAADSSDPDQSAATLTYEWDFDGDNQYDDATGMQPNFSATGLATGSYTVGLRVTDEAGETDTATAVIEVVVTALLPDPGDATKTALFVGGTTTNDTIEIRPSGNSGAVEVLLNGASQGTFTPTGGIVVYAQAGNDEVQVASSITRSAWLYGGPGDDRLKGGAGHDVLLGDDGDDLLVGGSGRDLLIGGHEADRIVGNADDDILVAGFTSHNGNQAALAAIMAEWTSSRTYSQRVANISDQSIANTDGSTFASRSNGNYFLRVDGQATVFDDDAADLLTGSSGLDWFLFNADGDNDATRDRATDLSATEFASDLDWIGNGF